MRTKKGVEAILRRIYETGGMTEAMEGDINSLRDELDEREGVLRRYGEDYDEEAEEYEFREREREDEYKPKYEEYKSKYDDLAKKYSDRFFNPHETTFEATERNQTEDIKRDGTQQTFDDLLVDVEGGK